MIDFTNFKDFLYIQLNYTIISLCYVNFENIFTIIYIVRSIIRCMIERRKIHTNRRICKLNPKAYNMISLLVFVIFHLLLKMN